MGGILSPGVARDLGQGTHLLVPVNKKRRSLDVISNESGLKGAEMALENSGISSVNAYQR